MFYLICKICKISLMYLFIYLYSRDNFKNYKTIFLGYHPANIVILAAWGREREKKGKRRKGAESFIDTISVRVSHSSARCHHRGTLHRGYISSGPPEMSNISLWSDLQAGDHGGGQRWGGFNISPGRERGSLSRRFSLFSLSIDASWKMARYKPQVTDSADI